MQVKASGKNRQRIGIKNAADTCSLNKEQAVCTKELAGAQRTFVYGPFRMYVTVARYVAVYRNTCK
jgi:hypothetical protein